MAFQPFLAPWCKLTEGAFIERLCAKSKFEYSFGKINYLVGALPGQAPRVSGATGAFGWNERLVAWHLHPFAFYFCFSSFFQPFLNTQCPSYTMFNKLKTQLSKFSLVFS